MIYRFYILLFLFLAMFGGCEPQDKPPDLIDDVQDPCDSTYQTPGDTVLQEPVDSVLIYRVLTITGGTRCRTIEEFSEELTKWAEIDTLLRAYNYDFPLAIRLDNYHPGEIIRGSVNLFYLGWTEIDSNYAHVDRFLVPPEEQLGRLQYLAFSEIEITSLMMRGKFVIARGGDEYLLDFLAEKE